MSVLEMIVIAVALAMDASCVAMANSINAPTHKLSRLVVPAVLFGVFQAMMPVIGYFSGRLVVGYFDAFSSWVVFGIFLLLGGKMIYDSLFGGEEDRPLLTLTPKLLVLQAVATSIDALAVGVGFSALSVAIFLPAVIIGVTTFLLCVGAGYLGKRLGAHLERKAGLLGGALLWLLAIKSLVAAIWPG